MNRIRYDELATLIARRQPACGSTTVIAVDGPSGSGKTGLSNGLAAVTGAAILHLEDIYPGWTGLAATPPLVRGVLDQIAVGEPGLVHRWDWEAGQDGPLLRVLPAPLLILDGVGSGAAIIRPYLSHVLWVDAPLEVRKRRALARDGDVYAEFWDTWAAQEAEHFAVEQTRIHADLLIDTGD
ncbi:MAG: 4-amino-4-deoxy-L-arabinose transferase [Aeromicrobium sp.]|nr:4-amino-4-deoxy-L-arabinose transferase [Aeromicrobium sp.]